MKELFIFLFGAGCGVGGTLLWLRKDIQKKLDEIGNGSDIPFEVSDVNTNKKEDSKERRPVATSEATRVNYNNIISSNYSGTPVPVMPREDEEDNDPEAGFVGSDETDGGIFEIDRESFDDDETFESKRLVYFEGDRVMSTESGTIITNPAMWVGSEWENCVGNYAKNTAFIRNSRLLTDYEIFVEEGLYTDEYGPIDNYRED